MTTVLASGVTASHVVEQSQQLSLGLNCRYLPRHADRYASQTWEIMGRLWGLRDMAGRSCRIL